jgi:hypothetical protein
MKTTFALALICLGATLKSPAVPLVSADLPADPAWFVHLDCDTLRPTAIGQYILAELDKPEAQAKLGALQGVFHFDPRKQLHGLTLYGPSDAAEDGVLLAYADFEADHLVTIVKGANDYQSSTHKGHTIHNWIDDKKKPKDGVKPRVYASIHKNRLIIFGQREAPVAAALDVLDHTVPNLSTSKTFAQVNGGSGTVFLQAAARKFNFASKDPNAAIFRLSKFLRLQIGESEHQIKATLSLEANDEEVAKNMAAIVQGLAALVKLQQEKPQAIKVAEALSIKQDGPVVLATLALTSEDVVGMMKAGSLKKAQKKSEKD